MALHLTPTARLAATFTFAFFLISVVYNFSHTPGVDLSLPTVSWSVRSGVVEDVVKRKASVVTGGVAMPYDMFGESVALIGAFWGAEHLFSVRLFCKTSRTLRTSA